MKVYEGHIAIRDPESTEEKRVTDLFYGLFIDDGDCFFCVKPPHMLPKEDIVTSDLTKTDIGESEVSINLYKRLLNALYDFTRNPVDRGGYYKEIYYVDQDSQ
jgi:hypothetical protein